MGKGSRNRVEREEALLMGVSARTLRARRRRMAQGAVGNGKLLAERAASERERLRQEAMVAAGRQRRF